MKNLFFFNQRSNVRAQAARCAYIFSLILAMLMTLGVGEMWADYYYRGGKNSWGATAMTVHNSGLYEYYSTSAQSFNSDQFKISKTTSGYDYNQSYVAKGFNGGSNDIGDYGGDNCYIWDGSNGYIIVYYPNTLINTTNKPKITFRTSLYAAPTFYIKHPFDGSSWTWGTMSRTGDGIYTYTGNCYTANGANVYTSKSDNNYLSPSGTSGVNNGVPAVWSYNAKSNSLSVAPAYTLTVNNDGHGSASGSVSNGIKMSTKYAISASSPSTGYHFYNWTRVSGGTCTFDNASSASTNVTVTGDASATVQANFALNTYTVAYNANDAQYPGAAAATGSTSSSSHTYGTAKALTSNGFSRAGYTFAGWATTADGSAVYSDGQSVTNLSSTHGATVTLYAQWTEVFSTVSFVASPTGKGTFQVSGSTVTSTEAGVTTTREVTAVPISGYSFSGWSITGGASISSTSTNPTTITGGGAGTAATLTATFVEDVTYYTLTFGVGSSPYNNGSISAKNASTSAAISSGASVLSGTNVQFTATPSISHYKLKGWYSDAACGSAIAGAGTTNPYTKAISATQSVYAGFEIKTCTITLNKNGGSTGAASVTATHGSTLPSFTAHARSGYTLTGYYTESSGGTKIIDASGALVASTSYANASKQWNNDATSLTLYAQWEEKMTTVTINVSPAGAGTLSVNSSAFTPGNTTTAGVSTSRSVVATAGSDFTFGSWSATGNATGTSSTNTYTLKGNGSAGTGTLTANMTLVPCKLWYGNTTFASESKAGEYTMSYDSEEGAYYYDVTTDRSPYCFRFYHNGSVEYSCAWGSDGTLVVEANGSKQDAATDVTSYGTHTTLKYVGESGTQIRIWFDYQNKKTWITADKDKQYVLRGANADDSSKADGMPGWSATTSYFDGLADGNTGTYSATLNAAEWYHLKVYDLYNKTWYGPTSGYAELTDGVYSTMGSGDDFYFQTTGEGSYAFTLDKSSGTKIKVDYPPAVTWTATSVYSGDAATITATATGIKSGKSIRFDLYAGTTATGDIIATGSGTTSSTTHTQSLSVTPTFGANDINKQYTVKITYNGSQTATYTNVVGRKWDIKVNNNCHWENGVYYYAYGNGENDEWPGVACSASCGSWYTVTLDGKYPNFILNNGNVECAKEQTGDLTTSISTYAAGSAREFIWASEASDGCVEEGLNKTYNLNAASLSTPTVTLTTYDVISTTQIYVEGTITNYGGAGSAASDMCELGFKIGETKYTTTCTDGSVFKRYITGLSANAEYSVKAYATSPHSTGESSATAHTTRATGSYTVKVRTGVSDPVPYIRAFVYSDEACGGTGLTANADGNGEAMTLAITGTTYKWYTYSLSNVYQKFYINENASSTETWDQTAPLEETCYWYHHGAAKNDRFGTMTCPYVTPQLMIETTAGGGEYEYLEMSGSGTVTKTVTLTAKSQYLFKIVYNAEWYGKASVNVTRAANTVTETSAAIEDNMAITTDAAGSYTFSFNTSTKAITVTYPTAYTVTFGMGTGGATIGASATSAGGSMTSGDYVAAGDDVTFTQTASSEGYTFAGWYDASTGGSAVSGMGTSDNVLDDIAADATVYSRYTPNNYTVSFDATTNGGTCGTTSKSVTYDAAYGELPTATRASKAFKGWFTLSSGGTQVTAETLVSTASNHTIYAQFEDIYSVTIDYKCGDVKLRNSSSTHASATALAPTIEAPEFLGYTFTGWSGSNATFADASSATTTVNAEALTTITANYSVIPTVYFKNNLNWDKVYVTFDCDWTTGSNNVPMNNGKPYFEMEQLGTSDIFSCVIPDAYVTSNFASWANNIAFDNHGFEAAENIGSHTGGFNAGEFLGRGDFDPSATMFIPYNGDSEERNGGTYYRTGCWMKYNSTDPGYKVYAKTYVSGSGGSVVDGTPVLLQADLAGGFEFKAKVNFTTANYTYGFMLHKEYTKNSDAVWYTNTGTITAETDDLPWHFYNDGASENGTRCGLKTESTGDYEFTVSFGTGRPVVNVTYPVSTGDWRLVYKDRAAWSGDAHDADWFIASRVIKAEADAVDTVSFFVSKATGANATVELQKCTEIDPETAAETWEKQGDNLDIADITSTGIYNFRIVQNGSKEASAAYLGGYVGNFYIRTDAAEGGWSNYKTSGSNTMTYSEYAEEHYNYFTHYYMKFVNTGTNIKFCIANDYSPCLTEYCVSDDYTNEWIEVYGNVRFMWDHRTNKVSRAYISGSGIVADRFLVLEGDDKMFDKDGNELTEAGSKVSALNDYEMNFTDDQNWIYETSVQAKPGARIKLTARYNGKIQYFYGSEGDRDEETTDMLIGGSGTDKYKVRIVYDFKTNRLMKAFMPEGAINDDLEINADLMIMREAQGDAQQITFGENGALSLVKTVYGSMKFNKYTVNNKEKTGGHNDLDLTSYERDIFYISFPFEVKLSDVFGFGTYGKHWIIEYYDGKGRAKNGYWADSEPNWKFVMPSQRSSFTLKANEGYILALDLEEMTFGSNIWNNGVEDVYLYFPSNGYVNDIEATDKLVEIDQTGYECKIGPRFSGGDDRRVKDSYWHCIGVPSFASYNRDMSETESGTTIDWRSTSMPYLYEWNSTSNTMSITTSETFIFKPMYSYLVQYAGESIYWSQVNATPSGVVARQKDVPTNVEFRLELQQDEQKADQAFVRLSDDEHVTTGFDFNYDLSKEFNNGKANVYTMITSMIDNEVSVTEAAGNVLPMTEQTTIVPIGVKVATNDDYTFSIPEGTEGIGVTLIDTETGIRTNLSAVDYTISLEAGKYDERFVLEISPIKHVPTEVETSDIRDQKSDVRKMLIDGLLYIVRDNKVYDARGARVE